jgi:hypothetical protein
VVAASGVVDRVPEVGRLPLHPPDALQDWALLAFHIKVTDSPASMVVELSCSLMVGRCADAAEVPAPLLADDRPSPSHAASNIAAIATEAPRARSKRQARRFIHDLPVWRSALPSRALACGSNHYGEIVDSSADSANVSPIVYVAIWRHAETLSAHSLADD